MALTSSQADLRRAHVNGAAGVTVSGAAWLVSALVFLTDGPRSAFFSLFICGLAISPVAQLATRFVFKAPSSSTGKRLELIALATIPVLL